MHYLDTCICVEFLRGRLKLGYETMRAEGPSAYRLPAIVVAELWYGAEHSSNPARNMKATEDFVSAFEIAPFDERAAKEYGRIRQLLGSQGKIIGDRDLMIAACAIADQAVLVTNNVGEFARVPGLRLESWSEVDL